jgi:hypothetical protein
VRVQELFAKCKKKFALFHRALPRFGEMISRARDIAAVDIHRQRSAFFFARLIGRPHKTPMNKGVAALFVSRRDIARQHVR